MEETFGTNCFFERQERNLKQKLLLHYEAEKVYPVLPCNQPKMCHWNWRSSEFTAWNSMSEGPGAKDSEVSIYRKFQLLALYSRAAPSACITHAGHHSSGGRADCLAAPFLFLVKVNITGHRLPWNCRGPKLHDPRSTREPDDKNCPIWWSFPPNRNHSHPGQGEL